MMLIRIVTILIFSVAAISVLGQATSNGGRFTIPDERACAPYGNNGEIVINVPECTGAGSACAVDFMYEPGKPFGTAEGGPIGGDTENVEAVVNGVPVNYTYTTPGVYYIAILFGAAGTGDIDYVPFIVTSNDPPDFNIYTCSNNAVQVDILDIVHDNYTIDYNEDNVTDNESAQGLVNPAYVYPAVETEATITIRPKYTNCVPNTKTATLIPNNIASNQIISGLVADGSDQITLSFSNIEANVLYQLDRSVNGVNSFSELTKTTNVNTYIDDSGLPKQNYYCYRLGAVDICNSPTPDYSNTICSVSPSVTVGDGFNSVSWKTNIQAATALQLNKNGAAINPGFSNTGTYTDNAVTCGTEYCYSFTLRYGGIESISNQVCAIAKATATAPPVEEITAVVTTNGVDLDWVELSNYTIAKYDIFRIPTNVSLPLTSTQTPDFTDDTYAPFQEVCYQIRFDDVCKNRSERSAAVCPIELKAELNPDNNDIVLSWPPYTGYLSGVRNYIVEKYDANGQLVDQFDTGTQTNYVDASSTTEQTFTYRVIAFSNSSGVAGASVSNEQTIIKSPRLWHPTAFIPESEHTENQTFSVKGIPDYITSYELQIFNRWGELMFSSTNMDRGWDGSYKGIKMPEGSYVFRSTVTDTAGRTFDYSGSVVLLRKNK